MAEEKKNTSIFQGVLNAIKPKPKRNDDSSAGFQGNFPNGSQFEKPKEGDSLENKQQNFLNWQSDRVSQDLLYSRAVSYNYNRNQEMIDFDLMDLSPEISSCLGILKDEILTKNEKGEILSIFSENERIKGVLKDLFEKRLNINYILKIWTRDLLKY